MPSLSKNAIKTIRSLRKKKFRQELGAFMIEGDKLVEEALNSGTVLKEAYLSPDSGLWGRIPNATPVSEKEMKQLTALSSPSPALAVVTMPPVKAAAIESSLRILALDGISDPGNMGTILRTADWFGIEHVLCSEDCVDIYNPKAVQSTMGSIFRLKVEAVDLSQRLEGLKSNDFAILASDLMGSDLSALSTQNDQKAVLIIGSESHGVSKAVLELADHRVRIEGRGGAESLNAATATAVMLYEWTRTT